MTRPLDEQTAVITGVGSPEGIGFAVAKRLHAGGLRVVITSTTDRIHARAREIDEPNRPVEVLAEQLGRSQLLPSREGSSQFAIP